MAQPAVIPSLGHGYRAVVFGASGGIGSAVAETLEADEACARLLALHRGSDPGLDLCDEASIARAAEHVAATLGTVELLFDATGVLDANGRRAEKRLAEIEPATMAESFRVNAIGPALLLKHFGGLLPRRGKGVFATVSARVGSIADNRRGGWYGYRASKAALNQIVRTAALELRVRHRHAVCVALQPGTVATRLSAPYRRADTADVLEPSTAAHRLLGVLDRLDQRDSGGFFDHRGEAVPW